MSSEKDIEQTDKEVKSIRIVGLPKGTVLWPTAVTALIVGFLSTIDSLSQSSILAYVFLGVFTINLLILFFEFGRGVVVALVGLAIGTIFAYAWASSKWNFAISFSFLNEGVTGASASFYLLFGAILLIMIILGVIVRRYFHYFVLSSNELVVKTGVLGDAERYASPQLVVKKEKPDIFESWLLFGSGRLTLIPGEQHTIFIIDNVPRIDKIEERMRDILGKIDVI